MKNALCALRAYFGDDMEMYLPSAVKKSHCKKNEITYCIKYFHHYLSSYDIVHYSLRYSLLNVASSDFCIMFQINNNFCKRFK